MVEAYLFSILNGSLRKIIRGEKVARRRERKARMVRKMKVKSFSLSLTCFEKKKYIESDRKRI